MPTYFKKYRELLKGSKYIFLLNITDRIFSFVILILLARTYPSDIFGQVVTVITLSMVFVSVFDLGLPVYIQKETALNKDDAGKIFSRVFILSSLLYFLYFGISFLTAAVIYPDIPFTLYIIISFMMYISLLVTITNKTLAGLDKYRIQFTAFTVPRILILICFAAGIYYFYFSLNKLMLIFSAGIFLNLIITVLYLRRHGVKIIPSEFSFKGAKAIITVSIPLGLAVIFNYLYDKTDLLLISGINGYDDAAFYNAAYGIFKSTSLAFSFLLVSGFTRVAELNRDTARIRLFFKEHMRLITVICLLCSAVILIFSGTIINIIYTEKFSSSVLILQILAFGITAMGLNNLTGIILNAMGYFPTVMFITMYAFIMNVLFNLFLLPFYGITAAAVITVLTEIFILITEWYYMNKIFKNLEASKIKSA